MTDKCKARIYGDFGRSHQCRNRAKKDGFCNLHHPDTKATALAYEQEVEQRGAVKALEDAVAICNGYGDRNIDACKGAYECADILEAKAAELRASKGEVK